MAVDLSDIVDVLKREVNAPGIAQLPNALDADYIGNLSDGFWEAYLDGFCQAYTEADGIVTPRNGTVEFPRELQQLVVFYAGFRIIRNQLRDIKTVFSAKAGTTEYEVQQAATLLTGILNELKFKRGILLTRLSDLGLITGVYIDGVTARQDALVWDYPDHYVTRY